MQITKLQTINGRVNQIFNENSIFARSLVDFADNAEREQQQQQNVLWPLLQMLTGFQ